MFHPLSDNTKCIGENRFHIFIYYAFDTDLSRVSAIFIYHRQHISSSQA